MATPVNPPQPTADYSHAIQSLPPKVRFQLDNIPPSQFLFLRAEDYLAFTIFTNSSPITLQLTFRFMLPDGQIKVGSQVFTTSGAINSFNFPLGECWLLSFALVRQTPTGQNVIAFVQCSIIRDQFTGSGQNLYGIVWQGFIQVTTGNGWPGTPSKEITDGPGNIRTIVGTVPAAGADISETVPLFRRWILLTIQAALTTSAAVANRNPLWQIDDGVNIVFTSVSFQNQAASLVIRYQGFNNLQTAAALNGNFPLNLPIPFPVRGGYHLKTSTVNLQAADQWTAPIYIFLEWGSWDT